LAPTLAQWQQEACPKRLQIVGRCRSARSHEITLALLAVPVQAQVSTMPHQVGSSEPKRNVTLSIQLIYHPLHICTQIVFDCRSAVSAHLSSVFQIVHKRNVPSTTPQSILLHCRAPALRRRSNSCPRSNGCSSCKRMQMQERARVEQARQSCAPQVAAGGHECIIGRSETTQALSCRTMAAAHRELLRACSKQASQRRAGCTRAAVTGCLPA
jgi:hypothetical protein